MEVLKKIKDYVNFENQDSKASFEAEVSREIQHHDRDDENIDDSTVELPADDLNEDVIEGVEEVKAPAPDPKTAEEQRKEEQKRLLDEKARLEEEDEKRRKKKLVCIILETQLWIQSLPEIFYFFAKTLLV